MTNLITKQESLIRLCMGASGLPREKVEEIIQTTYDEGIWDPADADELVEFADELVEFNG